MMNFAKHCGLTTRAALLGLTALASFGAAGVAARVGVTAATEGAPVGRPPQAVERVLHVGIDVQANEQISTKENDRAQLLFIDGTALTVGPNAQLTIDKFVYDPATKKGELAINASKGVFRLVGGKISKSAPVTITTPAGTIGIRGGIALLDVVATQLTAIFVFGECMDVVGGGETEKVCQPGYQVTVETGAAPSKGSAADPAVLGRLLGILAGGGNTGAIAGLMDALSRAGITDAAVLTSILSALGTTRGINGPINPPLNTLLATVNQAQNTNANGSPN